MHIIKSSEWLYSSNIKNVDVLRSISNTKDISSLLQAWLVSAALGLFIQSKRILDKSYDFSHENLCHSLRMSSIYSNHSRRNRWLFAPADAFQLRRSQTNIFFIFVSATGKIHTTAISEIIFWSFAILYSQKLSNTSLHTLVCAEDVQPDEWRLLDDRGITY